MLGTGRPAGLRSRMAGCALLGLFLPAVLLAQSLTQGALSGLVVRSEGGPVASATVTLEDEAGAIVRHLTTDDRGGFNVPLALPGFYALLIERAGFQPLRQRGVEIRAGRQTRIRIALTRRPPPITSVEERATPDQRFMAGTPEVSDILGGREFGRAGVRLDLAETGRFATGIVSPGTAEWGLGRAVLSLPQSQSRLTVDGLPVFTLRHGGLEQAPAGFMLTPPFLIQESRLIAAGADAEIPGAPGALLSVITRPATRAFQIEPFLAWGGSPGLSSDLNPGGLSLTNLQVGATISGSLVKDRAQFLVGGYYESLSLPAARPWQGNDAVLGGVPVLLDSAIQQISRDSFSVDAGPSLRPALRTLRGGMGSLQLDWQLSRVHRMSARIAGGRRSERSPLLGEDIRNAIDARLESDDMLGSATLISAGSRVSNEFRLGFQSASRTWQDGGAGTDFVDNSVGIGSSPLIPGRFERTGVDITESLLLQFGSAGQHRLRFGVRYANSRWKQDYIFGRQGMFQFGSLDLFQAGQGLFSDLSTSRPSVRFPLREAALFSHMHLRFSPALSGVASLRGEHRGFRARDLSLDATFLNDFGIRNDGVPGGKLNFSPRLGLLWSGGAGDRWRVSAIGARDHGGLDPARFAEAALTDLRARQGLGIFDAWPAVPDTITLSRGGRRIALFSPNSEYRDPRATKLDVEVQRDLAPGFSVHLTARYHHTDFLLRRSDLNLSATPSGFTQEGRPVYGTLVQSGALVVANPTTNRRFTEYDLVSAFSSTGSHDFVEAVLGATRDFGHGLAVAGSFSLSRARDNWLQSRAGDPAEELSPFASDPLGGGWSRGASDFDVPQRGFLTATWHSAGRVKARLAARYRYQSGLPYTPGFQPGADVNGDGSGRNDPAFLDPAIPGLPAVVPAHPCLDAQVGRFAARNSCREPGRHGLDFGAVLALPIRSLGRQVEVTLDVLNLFASRAGVWDHALILVDPAGALVTDPAGFVTLPLVANPNFGRLLSRRDEPRILRIGLRLGNW